MQHYKWNDFRSLERIKNLPIQEQVRQYWFHTNEVVDSSAAAAAASSSAGAGGAGGGTAFYKRGNYITTPNPETVILVMAIDGFSNFQYILCDAETGQFTNFIDTSISIDGYVDNIYVTQNQGYVVVINFDGRYYFLFIDATGKIVGSESQGIAPTTSYDLNHMDGKSIVLVDPDGGVDNSRRAYFFDGNSYSYHDFPGSTGFSVYNEWDHGMSDGTANFLVYYSDREDWYLMNTSGCSLIYSNIYSNNEEVYLLSYSFGDFSVLTIYNGSIYTHVKYYDSMGNLLHDLDLSESNFNAFDGGFYGINNYMIAFYDRDDSGVDYSIYNFNGKDLVAHTTSRGNNYYSINSYEYNSLYTYYDYTYLPGSFAYFMNDNDNYSSVFDTNSGCSYAKVVYFFASEGVFREYLISDDAYVAYSQYLDCGENSIQTALDYSDGQIQVLTLVPGKTASITATFSSDNISYFELYKLSADNCLVRARYSDVEYTVINNDGTLKDVLGLTVSYTGNAYNYRYQQNTVFLRDWNTNRNWTWNLDSGWQELDVFYSQRSYVWDVTLTNCVDSGSMLLFNPYNYSGNSFRVLTPNNITNDISLYHTDEFNYYFGSDMFTWLFYDGSHWNIEVYNYNGELINSITDQFTDYDSYWLSDKRALYILVNPEVISMVMINAQVKNSKNIYGDYAIEAGSTNDYSWWNNQ